MKYRNKFLFLMFSGTFKYSKFEWFIWPDGIVPYSGRRNIIWIIILIRSILMLYLHCVIVISRVLVTKVGLNNYLRFHGLSNQRDAINSIKYGGRPQVWGT